jgi:hypothetical protein
MQGKVVHFLCHKLNFMVNDLILNALNDDSSRLTT